MATATINGVPLLASSPISWSQTAGAQAFQRGLEVARGMLQTVLDKSPLAVIDVGGAVSGALRIIRVEAHDEAAALAVGSTAGLRLDPARSLVVAS